MKKRLKETAFLIILMYMNKKVLGAIIGGALLFVPPFGLAGVISSSAKAEETSSVFVANVSSLLSQSIESCGGGSDQTANISNTGSVGGDHFSSCYVVVHNSTNAPGYSLMIQSIDGVQRATVDAYNEWKYDVNNDDKVDGSDNYAIPYGDGVADGNTRLMEVVSENTPPTLPTLGSNYIAPTTATMTSPAEMNASVSPYVSVWGFAVPKLQAGSATSYFDNSYSTFSSSGGNSHGKYAKVPTTASVIKQTVRPISDDTTAVYFGTSISANQTPGVYKGVVIFTSVANLV